MTHDDLTRVRRAARGVAVLFAAILGGSVLAQGEGDAKPTQAGAAADTDSTRALLEKWVEARRLVSRTHSDWRVEKEALTERIAVVQKQIETVRQRITETEASLAAADEQKAALAKQREEQTSIAARLETVLTGLETRTRELLPRLPEPLREKLAPLTQQFAAEGESRTKLSLGARFGNVLAVLGLVQKWNREVHVTNEVRTLPDGQKAEVACLYLGLAQGYYVTPKGDAAGVGTAKPEGFVWTPRNEAAAAIAAAIAVYQSKLPAGFVSLPVELQ